MVIRSREFGDGSEYDMDDSQTSSMIPDHYVKRFWRKAALPIGGGTSKTVRLTALPFARRTSPSIHAHSDLRTDDC